MTLTQFCTVMRTILMAFFDLAIARESAGAYAASSAAIAGTGITTSPSTSTGYNYKHCCNDFSGSDSRLLLLQLMFLPVIVAITVTVV